MAFGSKRKRGMSMVRRGKITVKKSKKVGTDTEPKGKLKVKA